MKRMLQTKGAAVVAMAVAVPSPTVQLMVAEVALLLAALLLPWPQLHYRP